jgi:hypothetical protein
MFLSKILNWLETISKKRQVQQNVVYPLNCISLQKIEFTEFPVLLSEVIYFIFHPQLLR